MAMETNIEKRKESAVMPVERTRSAPTYIPVVDIIERRDELMMLADMPGARAEHIDINYDKGLLTIHARVEPRQNPQQTEYLLQEYGVGDFHRTFEVGEGIDPNKIEAEVKNGLLTLHLPKSEAFKPRKIAVKTQ
ncbi:MAG TPA: Hsp20/alpha crystallin family protein [Phycisphaerae bacterium]|nr:Hsp20/alpha crystallin family protein [Phycisphaerae bacterium]